MCASRPDGSLFVTDWYDPGVGGHAAARHRPRPHLPRRPASRGSPTPPTRLTVGLRSYYGDTFGQQFRRCSETPPCAYRVPKFDFMTATGRGRGGDESEPGRAYLAWTKLHELGAKAEPALLKLWKSDNPRHPACGHSGCSARSTARDSSTLDRASKDSDPDIRIVGIRLARQIGLDLVAIAKQVRRCVAAGSPRRRDRAAFLQDARGGRRVGRTSRGTWGSPGIVKTNGFGTATVGIWRHSASVRPALGRLLQRVARRIGSLELGPRLARYRLPLPC